MRWRVRATLADRPGMLGAVAAACGAADVNIVAGHVLSGHGHATDELVVETPAQWSAADVAHVVQEAGGADVAVTRTDDGEAADAATRYLLGLHAAIDGGRSIEEVLAELLQTGPPDLADYAGHDVLDLRRRDGSMLRISRAVPFTPVERARAQALLSLVGDAEAPVQAITYDLEHRLPLVRSASPADLDAIARLHERCSTRTLYDRYQVPLPVPLSTRLVRRLVAPDDGVAFVVQVGMDLVAHGLLQQVDERWTFRMLVEDAWHGRGVAPVLVRQAAGRAKALGAERLTFVTAPGSDQVLRAVGDAGFMARIETVDDSLHISVPLHAVRAISA